MCVGRGLRGNNDTCSALCQILVTSPATHKQTRPFWCWFPGGWACVRSGTLWVFPMNSPVRPGVSPATSTPTDVFSQFWGFISPPLEPWVVLSVLFPSCSSRFICTQMWDRPLHQPPPHPPCPQAAATASPCILSAPAVPRLPVSTPPALDECFFFNSLVVRFPYSSIFWRFWLFSVLKFVVVLLLVVWGSKAYLPMPPSWPEVCLTF